MKTSRDKTAGKWLEFVHLCDALDAEGCAVCTLIEQACQRYLDHLFYECVNDVGVRRRLAASNGFCNWHAHLALRIPHADTGIAIIYDGLLRGVIERVAYRGSVLPTAAPCPVCESAYFAERTALSELLRWFDDAELQAHYGPSFGLCLPHLQRASDEYKDHPHLPALRAAELEKLRRLQHELQEFNRKRDYRFADEPKGAEQTAWRRVIEKFTGKREVFGMATRP